MAYDIPTKEPVSHQAGTSLIFKRTLPDFPADTWTLSYALRSANNEPIDISASADGRDHSVNVPAATTLGWLDAAVDSEQEFLLVGYVTDGTDRHEVYRNSIVIQPYITDQTTLEWRSYARRMLALIEAMLLDELPRGEVSYSVNGHSRTAKSNQELLDARAYFKAEVFKENNTGRQRKILIRNVSPR